MNDTRLDITKSINAGVQRVLDCDGVVCMRLEHRPLQAPQSCERCERPTAGQALHASKSPHSTSTHSTHDNAQYHK
jgi:hypothetical protein